MGRQQKRISSAIRKMYSAYSIVRRKNIEQGFDDSEYLRAVYPLNSLNDANSKGNQYLNECMKEEESIARIRNLYNNFDRESIERERTGKGLGVTLDGGRMREFFGK